MNDNRVAHWAGPISAQIRDLRLAKGWTLAELAKRAGTSAPTLHRYESGWDRFEVRTLRTIAAALGARLEVRLVSETPATEGAALSARSLVRSLAPLFWDKPLTSADLREYPDWVLSRVLMFGARQQVIAARRYFGDASIQHAAQHRSMDARTRNYWSLILGDGSDASEGTERKRLEDSA